MSEELKARFVGGDGRSENMVGQYGVAAYSPHYDTPGHYENGCVFFTPDTFVERDFAAPHTYYVKESELVFEGDEGYESDERRYYGCGCCPADEEFCKVGDFLVWTGREACQEMSVLPLGALPEYERLEKLDTASALLMHRHLKKQEEAGEFTDVDLSLPKYREPDGDYDETILGR